MNVLPAPTQQSNHCRLLRSAHHARATANELFPRATEKRGSFRHLAVNDVVSSLHHKRHQSPDPGGDRVIAITHHEPSKSGHRPTRYHARIAENGGHCHCRP